jgi:hypothetical protein
LKPEAERAALSSSLIAVVASNHLFYYTYDLKDCLATEYVNNFKIEGNVKDLIFHEEMLMILTDDANLHIYLHRDKALEFKTTLKNILSADSYKDLIVLATTREIAYLNSNLSVLHSKEMPNLNHKLKRVFFTINGCAIVKQTEFDTVTFERLPEGLLNTYPLIPCILNHFDYEDICYSLKQSIPEQHPLLANLLEPFDYGRFLNELHSFYENQSQISLEFSQFIGFHLSFFAKFQDRTRWVNAYVSAQIFYIYEIFMLSISDKKSGKK